jgi:1,4-alpha-glucan branching enzyme
MHPLGNRSGVVVRAFLPGAAKVVAVPLQGGGRAPIVLERIHDQGLFEGVSPAGEQVHAYELEVQEELGREIRTRDPYSFLPSLGDLDLHLFGQGNDRLLYRKLGAQFRILDGVAGVGFAVWAPNARRVSVVGDFNGWDGRRHAMRLLGVSGVWEIFIPGLQMGALYKFEVLDLHGNLRLKTDPFGFFFEASPKNAAIVWNTEQPVWDDDSWLERRRTRDPLRSPMSVYELHLGSWRKKSAAESLNYRELAGPLIDYVRQQGFSHVEFLPVAEHAYYPSWGYQVTGFYAPTHRYGTPDDFQYLIQALHDADIGVIVDWVPAHFPRDDWALERFDGTALYEHEDPRLGAHQDWGTLVFNYGRHEVANFLTANALFWADRYHVDGLRVDAVASMLYLDYSRREGEWIPNRYGGRENLEALEFLKRFNHLVHTEHPGLVTIAEESTAWPLVTRPPYVGGLGFTFKWNMGWMHDTLSYFKHDPIHRKYHQNDLTFAMLYHHHENFVLPLSHDEVVHGKGSLLGRTPGDDWQRFANLRALFAYQWMFPGKKLLFMGGEIGQSGEWDANSQVDWALLGQGPYHAGLQRFVADLNRLYLRHPALWEGDYDADGFFWVDCADSENSVLSFIRQSRDRSDQLLVILNLTPVVRDRYSLGLPAPGRWAEVLNSDAECYGGSNLGNRGCVIAEPDASHSLRNRAVFLLPPLAVLVFHSDRSS